MKSMEPSKSLTAGSVVTKQDAVRIAEEHANQGDSGPDALVVDDEWTIERDYGWLFMYNTPEFVRTRNRRDALVGNAPLLVLRENGLVVQFPTSYTREKAIADYEADPKRFVPAVGDGGGQ